ncbi:phage distal tail protein [Streptomyces sp. SP18CS02]|uniref:phage distal tail protein n=1 Tax=Streptomyces sp. SP18CS02 TaxID=3002531 RepID=UPI002E77009C|nr:phage tail protein [Streptomyces sp. SP18CS02]MEE1751737.1 phage tail family protein [Streptomyces sp. SP18CS02]
MAATATTTPRTPDDTSPGSLIARDGQIQWAGLLLGPGTPYEIDRQGMTGWEDLPEADLSDADRPTAHGAWPGAQYARPRRIGAQVWLLTPPGGDPLDTLRTLRRSLALGDEEQWLAVRVHGETLVVRARVTQRVLPADRQLITQGVARASVQWLATDPRRYAVDERSASTGAPEPETGLTWPLTWPLEWGEAASTGDMAVTNDGSAPTQPVITFRGPCVNPALTERGSGRRLRYLIELAADDELVVDTAAGTVTLNGTASRRHTAAPDSGPEELFAFGAGRGELAFRPEWSAPGASASVRWRSAEW